MNAQNARSVRPPRVAWRSFAPACAVLLLSLFYGACDFGMVPADERAPKVQIVRPGDQASVGNEVTVRITATPSGSDNFISFINVNLNSKLLGEATLVEGSDPPVYAFTWNTNATADGEYRLEAVAFDRQQARGLSNPVRVKVQNVTAGEGPATLIASPRDNESLEGLVRIIAQPQPGEPAVSRMELLVDGVVIRSLEKAPYEFEWDTSQEGAGSYNLQVRAFSAPGVFKYSSPVSVKVSGSSSGGNNGNGNGTGNGKGKVEYRVSGYTGDVKGSVAVGFNNDLYIGTLSDTLYAFSAAGRLRWKMGTKGPIRSTPVVGNNEDVFVTSEDGRLYGFTSTGMQLWTPYNTGTILRSTPSLGVDGYLYFGDGSGRIHAVNSFNGQSLQGWPIKASSSPIVVPPVMARDRTLIVASTDGFVSAYGPDGTKKWQSKTNVGAVMVGMALVEREFVITLPNGTTTTNKGTVLYVVSNDGFIYALSGLDGSLSWSYPLNGPLRSGPVVGSDGAIYVGTSTGLIALNEETNAFTPRLRFIYAAEDVGTPAIDANENIYFVSAKKLVSINPNNTPYWAEPIDLKTQADGPLTIGRDGRIYVAGNNGILLGVQTGAKGLAKEKWPMFQRNARHTGRLGIDATDG